MVRFLSLVLFMTILWATRPVAAEPPQILRLVANNWEPYTGEQLLNKGLASDIVATVLRRAGYDVDIQIVPWSRALKGVIVGNYHGIIGAWHNKEREATMVYSESYLSNDLVLFKRKERDISFKKVSDLKPNVIGIIRDYSYGDELDKNTVVEKKVGMNIRTNLVRLHKGLIDLYPEDKYVMKHVLNKNYPEYKNDFDYIETPLSRRALHMTISRKTNGYEKIIKDFNKEFESMKAEGLLSQIVAKHKLSN